MPTSAKYVLPPATKTHQPPPGGWKPHTYYVVRIAVSPTNVIHDAILHVGFSGPPDSPLAGNYTSVMVDSGGDGDNDYPTPEFLHYLAFKSVIEGMTEN